MKKVLYLTFLLLCVCSCEKDMRNDVQKLLVGSWDVSLTHTSSNGKPFDVLDCTSKFTFLENGRGLVVYYIKIDGQSSYQENYSYYYDKGNNAVVFDFDDRTLLAEVESLTKDSFVFHSKGDIVTTWNGKKIK